MTGFARQGDTVVVWKLERLARSIKQLVETIEDLKAAKALLADPTITVNDVARRLDVSPAAADR